MPEHLIFISYAHPDRDRVIPFLDQLESDGFNAWIDCRRIKPGQNWPFEIKRAFEKAAFVLAFISQNSFERRGFVQRELKLALDKLMERLDDDIYIIPIILDDNVEIPASLKNIQAIRASEPSCHKQITESIQHQLERLGAEKIEIQEEKQITWKSTVKKESWEGLPGYEVELQFLNFESPAYPNVAEIGAFIQGDILRGLFENRTTKLEQDLERFNYGQDSFGRTNTYDAHCGEPTIVGKMITISYGIDWYGAGAAHPNYHFQTYSFLLDPVILIDSLEKIFKDGDSAFLVIRDLVRQQLYEVAFDGEDGDEPWKLDKEWIDRGTEEWKDFSSFVFKEESVEFLFAPYHVAAYACGPQVAEIPYTEFWILIEDIYLSALDLEPLKWAN